MTRVGDTIEFAGLAQVAAGHFGVPRVMIEKDYWVTETLRELAESHPGEFVFKGGTSLSKGFGLIHRFSEDIDILLTDAFATQGERDRAMKAMVSTVETSTPLVPRLLVSSRGVKRNVAFSWPRHGSDAGGTLTGIAPEILLEMGIRGAHWPSLDRPITSMLTTALTRIDAAAARDFLSEQDLAVFRVPTLHPGRTLVEKLLLLAGHAERLVAGDIPALPTRQGRHIYDVIQLLDSADVHKFLDDRIAFLAAVEHAQGVSAEHWNSTTVRPAEGFGVSAIVTGGEVVDHAFAAAYASDVPGMLIGGDPLPDFSLLEERVVSLADKL
jgi:predicted nucleotidyltransferase component of viral defense system